MRLLVVFLLAVCGFGQSQQYILGFLRAHPERKELPAEEANRIQAAHMAHLRKMSQSGALVGAGPLLNSPDLRGVLIFKNIKLEEARKMASEDPTVLNKRLRVDLSEWTARPGIGDKVAAILKENPQAKLTMTRHTLVIYWKTAAAPPDLHTSQRPELKAVMQAHREFFREMFEQGKVITAGPFPETNKEFHGVWVYRSDNAAEALELSKRDSLVKAGYAEPHAFVWMVADGVMP
jgi:uncharacterized protein YciI